MFEMPDRLVSIAACPGVDMARMIQGDDAKKLESCGRLMLPYEIGVGEIQPGLGVGQSDLHRAHHVPEFSVRVSSHHVRQFLE